jgi:hypothetical protein
VGFEKIPTTPISLPPMTIALVPHELVHLVEEKMFAQIGEEDEVVNSARWVVDTGSTNHMTATRSAYSILDTGVYGTVKFGDGSVVWIEGCGTIIFSCKSGEHHSFSRIYYIPKLKTNIFSLGQLNEEGMKSLSNLMSIRDDEEWLMSRIPRAPNRLYVLNTTVAQPVCLVAHGEENSWRWHGWLGHLNFQALRKMVNQE